MWTEREGCRNCGGPFKEVLDLGPIYPSEFVDSDAHSEKVPLTLVVCNVCDLVQLQHTVDQDELYRQYWYQSGLNRSMVESLKDVVINIEDTVTLEPNDIVLDIGCNDGTLLDLYSEPELVKVGFDPARNLVESAEQSCDIFFNGYFSSAAYNNFKLEPAKVITTIAMFYDLEDPNLFIEEVYSILRDDGIWVIQLTDLISMLRINAFDNICHEHLEYYSLNVLMDLLANHGLTINDVSYNNVNGGSLRAYVSHLPTITTEVETALASEFDYFQGGNRFVEFKDRAEEIKNQVVGFIKAVVAGGSSVAVMGASTKGNTLLQYFGLDDSLISHAAEINPEKFGRRTVGTNIPIIDEKHSLALNPDYYLILPWHFIHHFLDKNDEYLNHGGAFIVPMPQPLLYTKNMARKL